MSDPTDPPGGTPSPSPSPSPAPSPTPSPDPSSNPPGGTPSPSPSPSPAPSPSPTPTPKTLPDLLTDLNSSIAKLWDKECLEDVLCTCTTIPFFSDNGIDLDFEPKLTLYNTPTGQETKVAAIKTTIESNLKEQYAQFAAEINYIFLTYKAPKETANHFFGLSSPQTALTGGMRRIFSSTKFKIGEVLAWHQKMLSDRLAVVYDRLKTTKYFSVTVAYFVDVFNLNKNFEPKLNEYLFSGDKNFYEGEMKKQWNEFIKQIDNYFQSKKANKLQLAADFFKAKNTAGRDQTIRDLWASSYHSLDTLLESHQRMLDERLQAVLSIETSSSCFPIFPGEEYEHIKVDTQLVMTFAVVNPIDAKEAKSRWHVAIPKPIPCDKLDWCTHFEPMQRTLGNVIGTVRWQKHRLRTYAYGKDEEEIKNFFKSYILPLCTLQAVKGNDGEAVRVSKSGSPNRKPRERLIKCVQAAWVKEDEKTGEVSEIWCLTRPGAGC